MMTTDKKSHGENSPNHCDGANLRGSRGRSDIDRPVSIGSKIKDENSRTWFTAEQLDASYSGCVLLCSRREYYLCLISSGCISVCINIYSGSSILLGNEFTRIDKEYVWTPAPALENLIEADVDSKIGDPSSFSIIQEHRYSRLANMDRPHTLERRNESATIANNREQSQHDGTNLPQGARLEDLPKDYTGSVLVEFDRGGYGAFLFRNGDCEHSHSFDLGLVSHSLSNPRNGYCYDTSALDKAFKAAHQTSGWRPLEEMHHQYSGCIIFKDRDDYHGCIIERGLLLVSVNLSAIDEIKFPKTHIEHLSETLLWIQSPGLRPLIASHHKNKPASPVTGHAATDIAPTTEPIPTPTNASLERRLIAFAAQVIAKGNPEVLAAAEKYGLATVQNMDAPCCSTCQCVDDGKPEGAPCVTLAKPLQGILTL